MLLILLSISTFGTPSNVVMDSQTRKKTIDTLIKYGLVTIAKRNRKGLLVKNTTNYLLTDSGKKVVSDSILITRTHCVV